MSTVPPMDATEIAKLADLESREVLLGKLAGAMLASLSQAVYLLNAPLARLPDSSAPWRPRQSRTPSILKGGAGEPVAAATAATEEPAAEEAPDTGAESTEAPAEAGAEDAASEDAPASEETTTEASPESTEA